MKDKFILLSLDIDILFRAFAIIAIIFLHVKAIIHEPPVFHIVGGSTLLLVISGFNMARFQSKKLFEGFFVRIIFRFCRKIILPYYLIIILYQIWKKEIDWHSLLLISNYFGRFGNFLEPFWFIEALLQILIIFTGLFSIPLFRKTMEKYPYWMGLALLLITVLLRLSHLTDKQQLGIRTADQLLCIYVFGWCLWFAKAQWQKLMMTALIFTLFPYLYGIYTSYFVWLVTGCLAIMWQPKIVIPPFLHKIITEIGASTFYIYLIHIIPIHILALAWHVENKTIMILSALLLGIAVHKVAERIKL